MGEKGGKSGKDDAFIIQVSESLKFAELLIKKWSLCYRLRCNAKTTHDLMTAPFSLVHRKLDGIYVAPQLMSNVLQYY